jgi:hypothetical protein
MYEFDCEWYELRELKGSKHPEVKGTAVVRKIGPFFERIPRKHPLVVS